MLTKINSEMVKYLPSGVGAVETTVYSKLGETVSVKDFGAVGDGVTDDAIAFQLALATGRTVVVEANKTYKLNSGISVNFGKQSLISQGSVLDFSGLPSNAIALQLINANSVIPGDLASPLATSNKMVGFSILGPGKAGVGAAYASNVTGVHVSAPYTTVENCLIYGFGYGVDFLSEGFIQTWDKVAVGQCKIGVRTLAGGANYGERISFTNSVIYNSQLGISNNCATGALQFTNCSIDYSLKQLEATNSSTTELHNTWIEFNDAGAGNVHLSLSGGAVFTMIGGRVQQNGVPGALLQAGLLHTDVTSHATFRDVFLFNCKNTNNVLDAGNGLTQVFNSKSYAVSNLPSKISAVANNCLSDGGFSGSNISDLWAIVEDTATLTNRSIGANISLALSSAEYRSGTKSLKISKTAGGAAGSFALTVPVEKCSRVAFEGWYKKPAAESSSATVFITTQAALIQGVLPNGVPNILNSVSFDTLGIGGTDSLIDWTKISTGMDRITPSWATHFVIYVNATAFQGNFYFDDFNVSVM